MAAAVTERIARRLASRCPIVPSGPWTRFEAKESKQALLDAVEAMPERERTVLTMYYYDGMTLTEIGAVLGVTESRVCQIHTKALRQLRSKLADRPDGHDRRATAATAPAAPDVRTQPAAARAATAGAPGTARQLTSPRRFAGAGGPLRTTHYRRTASFAATGRGRRRQDAGTVQRHPTAPRTG